jgi:hypothetical protein
MMSFFRKSVSLKKATCLFMAALISVGTPVLAGGPVEIRGTDVSLNGKGALQGTVLNASALPVEGVDVHILHNDTVVASTTSDKNGNFSVSGLRNGAHSVQVGETRQPVRFWTTQAAPPAAVANMSIVVDEQIVRGQQGNAQGRISNVISSNVFTFLLIGGAIAVTMVTTLDDDDTPASP